MSSTNLKRGPASPGKTNEPKGGPPTNATSPSAAWHEAARNGVVAGPTGLKAGSNEVLMESIFTPGEASDTVAGPASAATTHAPTRHVGIDDDFIDRVATGPNKPFIARDEGPDIF